MSWHIRYQRRHKEQSRRLRGWHDQAEQAHGDRRQAEADHAFDKSGEQKCCHDRGEGRHDVVHGGELAAGSGHGTIWD
jgi:hypothetical protein